MDWLRWWHGTVTDPKFQRVARMSGASVGEVLAVWACLLECASSVPSGDSAVTACDGSVTSQIVTVTRGDVTRFNCDDCDVLLGFSDGKCDAIVTAMTSRGLIAGGRLAGWEERQPSGKSRQAKPATSGAERTRAYRERKKAAAVAAAGVTHGDVTVTGVTSRDDCDAQIQIQIQKEKVLPPVPPKGEKATKTPVTKGERAKPKRPLPEPFVTTPAMLAWADGSAPAVNLDRETEKFIDYWTGQGGAKADWHATWRNWMRRAQDDLERRGMAKPVQRDPDDTSWIDEDDGL